MKKQNLLLCLLLCSVTVLALAQAILPSIGIAAIQTIWSSSRLMTDAEDATNDYSSKVEVQAFADINASPSSFSGTLPYQGDSIIAPLTITNNGDEDLEYSIDGASLQIDKGLNVLAIKNFATTIEYPKLFIAINTYFDDYILEEAEPESAAELTDLLDNTDIVLIPESEDVDVPLFTSFAPVLQNFVNEGGTVIFAGANDGAYIFATDLFDGTHAIGAGGTTSNPLTILLPEDPLMENISSPYPVQATTFLYEFTNPDIVRVLESSEGKDVIAYRNIGEGKAIFIGHDYKFSNEDMKRVIANAVRNGNSGGSDWLYISQNSGTLAPGQTVTIDVELNANYSCGGSYAQDLIITSNDPDQPIVTIPCTFEITGTTSYAASPGSFTFSSELQQFDTETQLLNISNSGTYELHVTIASSSPGFVVEPSSFTVPGCNGNQQVNVTFAPLDVQTYSGTLSISTSAAPFPFTIPLTGTSVGAPITTITPNPVEVSVMTGEIVSQDIIINNTGIGPLTYNIDTSDFDPIINVVIFSHPTVNLNDIAGINAQLAENFAGNYSSASTNAINPAQLAAALANADMFIVPGLFGSDAVNLFSAFEQTLANFADNGGTVVFFGSSVFDIAAQESPAITSGLFDGQVTFDSFNPIDVVDHPLTNGLPNSFTGNFYPLILADDFDGIELITQEAGTVLATRDVGAGRAIYFGANGFGFASSDEITVFNNIISWTQTTLLAAWLDLHGDVTDGYVSANSSETLSATFNSGDLLGGVYQTEIVLTTNDPVQPTITVPVTMTVIGVPQISVDALSLDYGTLVIGDNDAQRVRISNEGTDNLIIGSITTNDPVYTISESSLTIPPFGSADLDVTFTPTAIQNYSGTLTLASNVGNISIALSGQGQGAPISSASPESITVSLIEGETSTQTITVNNGAAAAGSLSWQLSGQDAPRVLVLQLATNPFSYEGTLTALDTYAPSAIVSSFNSLDAQALSDSLEGKDVFFVPALDFTNLSNTTMTLFGPALEEYANNGGTVVFANTSNDNIVNTGLLSGFGISVLFGTLLVVDPMHPITTDIPDDYQPSNLIAWMFDNPDIIPLALNSDDNNPIICYRNIGLGSVIYWGLEPATTGDAVMGESLSNMVAYLSGELPTWLTASPGEGILPAGNDVDITLNFDSEGLGTGVYTYNLIIYTNDPANPSYTIPCTMNVIAMPIAGIGANNTVGCGSGTIEFSDETLNVATSWAWDFGDGTTSTVQNPTHTYTSDGSYTVSLTACNDLGCNTITYQDYITIDLTCEIFIMPTFGEFSGTQCNGVLLDHGGEANYSGSAATTYTINADESQGIIFTFTELNIGFDFIFIYEGDGITGDPIATITGGEVPDPIIVESGVATVFWQANDFQFLSGFVLNWQCILPTIPPVSNFSSQIGVECQGEVLFTDLSTNYPNQYTWDFGDGTSSTEEEPTHNYAQSGTYNVTLHACNPIGCDDITLPVTINNVFAVTPTIPECGHVGPILFVAGAPGAINYQWNFGNGNGANGAGASTPVAAYNLPGTYTVTLIVTSSTGCQRTITQQIVILPAGGDCSTISVDNPVLGSNISLSPNPTTGIFQLQYPFSGEKQINLRVIDALGREVIIQNTHAIGGYDTTLDLSTRASGLYFVLLSTPEGTITKRVMVQ